jgi:hypothetical protein
MFVQAVIYLEIILGILIFLVNKKAFLFEKFIDYAQ